MLKYMVHFLAMAMWADPGVRYNELVIVTKVTCELVIVAMNNEIGKIYVVWIMYDSCIT